MSEFKVGDKVRLEGTITDMWKSHVYAQLKGDSETVCNVRMDALAHAKPIQPKPRYDWSSIPPEYDWAATDRGGTVYAYKNKPVHDAVRDYWYDGKGPAKHIRHGSVTEDWRDSLEQRPEEVEAAVKVAEEKVLDLSSPIRIVGHPHIKVLNVSGPTLGGYYLVDGADGMLYLVVPSGLENIPEPKRTVTAGVIIIKDSDELWMDPELGRDDDIVSRAKVTYTDGEGWSIEEIK